MRFESLLKVFVHCSSFNVCAFIFCIKNMILTYDDKIEIKSLK